MRRYVVRGSVQGVGYRYFVLRKAAELTIHGTVRNLDDGSVEVIAAGTEEQQSALAGYLQKGPTGSDVRGVIQENAPLRAYTSFSILR